VEWYAVIVDREAVAEGSRGSRSAPTESGRHLIIATPQGSQNSANSSATPRGVDALLMAFNRGCAARPTATLCDACGIGEARELTLVNYVNRTP
jgi:hypothetical protein